MQMKVKFEGNEAKRLLSGGMQNAVAPAPATRNGGFVQRAIRKQMPKAGAHGGIITRMAGRK